MQFQAHVRSVSSVSPTRRVTGKVAVKNDLDEDVLVDEVEYGSKRDRVTIEIDGGAASIGDEEGFTFAPPAELFIDSPPGIWTEGQLLTVTVVAAE